MDVISVKICTCICITFHILLALFCIFIFHVLLTRALFYTYPLSPAFALDFKISYFFSEKWKVWEKKGKKLKNHLFWKSLDQNSNNMLL